MAGKTARVAWDCEIVCRNERYRIVRTRTGGSLAHAEGKLAELKALAGSEGRLSVAQYVAALRMGQAEAAAILSGKPMPERHYRGPEAWQDSGARVTAELAQRVARKLSQPASQPASQSVSAAEVTYDQAEAEATSAADAAYARAVAEAHGAKVVAR